MTTVPEDQERQPTPREFIEQEVAGLRVIREQHRDNFNHVNGAIAAYEAMIAKMPEVPADVEEAIAAAPNVEKLDDHRGKGKKADPAPTPPTEKDPA